MEGNARKRRKERRQEMGIDELACWIDDESYKPPRARSLYICKDLAIDRLPGLSRRLLFLVPSVLVSSDRE
jgi:hypothetical protein